MVRLTLLGNTFSIKNELKAEGFKWNSFNKAWYKDFEQEERAKALSTAYEANGVYGSIKAVTPEAKKYMVKEGWIFNLESMHDKLFCLFLDIREGKLQFPFKIAGKAINSEDDLDALQDEAETLEWKAKSGKVTSKEYGRIREIVAWRIEQRYATCVANGMDEATAGGCFEDL